MQKNSQLEKKFRNNIWKQSANNHVWKNRKYGFKNIKVRFSTPQNEKASFKPVFPTLDLRRLLSWFTNIRIFLITKVCLFLSTNSFLGLVFFLLLCQTILFQGNIHKWRPTFFGHLWPTYPTLSNDVLFLGLFRDPPAYPWPRTSFID